MKQTLKTFKRHGQKVKFQPLTLNDTTLTLNTIKKIDNFTTNIRNFPNIYINLKKMKLEQKLPITILEDILYFLITEKNKNIILDYELSRNIFTESFRSSPLIFLGNSPYYDKNKFIKEFKFFSRRYESNEISHYRRLVPSGKNYEFLSIVDSDVYSTFPQFVSNDTKKMVTQLVTELVGNVLEHTDSYCLLDLDITPNNYTNKKDNDGKKYFGINISILNRSDKLIFNEIKDKILNNIDKISGRNASRYKFVYKTYENHKQFFGNNYSEDDFWTLATMQHKISGRPLNSTGGTGLTTLVNALQKASNLDQCYIITGEHTLNLEKKFLSYNDDKWLGFNDSNDLSKKPNELIFQKSPLNFNGTAFNLSFIMEG